ncbi:hypothetical protein [Antrihabitans sp. YC2-6]|uniref:hypothetical protein n=1 Tax=Antrihabitans sp. YC2-6 TaxID=2799498 RepID=UPI0018F5780C|nr:hypothetical protein [Antrihabitans sp. YC2-6]MBJ8343791.1 hypothetical protein [Antrihabitans sp. YC2-6]
MHAQLMFFDGPRTAAQLAAADFANQERIKPATAHLAGFVDGYVLRRADGSEVVVVIADSEQHLLDGQKAIMATNLLPGEDVALLPGPDRIELFPVIDRFGARAQS